jgi:hypothetical protein
LEEDLIIDDYEIAEKERKQKQRSEGGGADWLEL